MIVEMKKRGFNVDERDVLFHPGNAVSPACRITGRLPLACAADHGFNSVSVPAFPKKCVGHFYALAGGCARVLPNIFRLFSLCTGLPSLWVFTHRSLIVT